MIGQLVLYIVMLLVGGLIGHFNLAHPKLDKALSKLQILTLMLLLFVMGIRLGANEKVVNALGTIGLRAFVLATASVVFSILFVYIGKTLYKYLRGGRSL